MLPPPPLPTTWESFGLQISNSSGAYIRYENMQTQEKQLLMHFSHNSVNDELFAFSLPRNMNKG